LLNLFAEHEVEMSGLLDDLAALAPRIIEVEALLAGVSAAAPITQGVTAHGDPAPAPEWATAPAAPAGATSAAKACMHGPMTFREGVSAKGPWKAWFCPTPKGTPGQCKAEFIR
jgi:hypothetical protein